MAHSSLAGWQRMELAALGREVSVRDCARVLAVSLDSGSVTFYILGEPEVGGTNPDAVTGRN